MKSFKIYLASQSPRRRELLSQAGYEYTLVESAFDEASLRGSIPDPREYVCANAVNKGRWVVENSGFRKQIKGPTIIISADTIVVLGKTILEKPKNTSGAVSMLQSLSEKTHTVLTSMCFHFVKSKDGVFKTREETFESDVTFRCLSDAEIRAYVASGEPMDKAGSYALQGRGASFVKKIHGSNTNVIGLPLAEAVEWLEDSRQIFDTMD